MLPLMTGASAESDRPTYAALGVPLFPDASVQMVLRTLAAVFPYASIFADSDLGSLVVIAALVPFEPDFAGGSLPNIGRTHNLATGIINRFDLISKKMVSNRDNARATINPRDNTSTRSE